MRPLSAQRLLEAWEGGQDKPLQERSLALLGAGLPERPREDLEELTVGQRDALLLRLRERTLGPTLHGSTRCPRCTQRISFAVEVDDVQSAGWAPSEPWEGELARDGYAARFRLPTGRDLAAAAACASVEEAVGVLLGRCVVAASSDGSPIDPRELPAEMVDAIGEQLEARDPLADVPLALTCDFCDHDWLAVLDIGSFFWREVSALAERLLGEVHTLARAYGWSEREILSISAARRQFYLEQVGG